jgi:starch-binding outer membrane protein, SusD/RagB family
MNRYAKAGFVLSLVVAAGCESFLTGTGLSENPNEPVDASAQAQFVAVQANMFTRFQGQVARSAAIYTQQLIGSNNQQLSWATQYQVVESNMNDQMNPLYTGQGLLGLRNVQAAAKAAGDAQWEGIAKIWEAFLFGMAASVWGDLPYREAVNPEILTPKLDSQQQIYTDVLALLDEGIALLGGAGPGPGVADLVYGGDVARWRRAAYTMKARFLLHLVEKEGTARYTQAIAAANLGINEAPTTRAQAYHGQAPGDFRAFHGATLSDGNVWAQFLNQRQDVVAGHVLVQLLKDRSDPRLTEYFDPAAGTATILGMNAEAVLVGTGQAAVVNQATRRALTFRQPIVTWNENQLILAEAKFRTGDVTGATTHVNNVRTALGLATLGTVTLSDIMLEKYIAQFQNIDVWNDFKRTCIPLVKPYQTNAEVPGRLPYGSNERNANPNLPLPSEYPAKTTGASPLRNWNDPAACPRP